MDKIKQIKIGDLIIGRLSVNASGSAYLVSTELPKDIYIHKTNTKKSFHLDNVKIEIIEGNGRSIEGKVIEIIERFRTEFVGIIEISSNFAYFKPDSNKIPTDFYVPLSELMEAKDGQKVMVKLVNWFDGAKNPNGSVIKVLGYAGEHETEIHSILEEYGLPYNFDIDIILEAESISTEITEKEIAKRKDMRSKLTFTIDPADAKDFDDALSIEWVDGILEVGVHIADVSHYLRPDTELDKEAYNRGTSVYLVDRCVPMLPEGLSNGLCSLRPHEDKLCFSAIFKLDNKGKVIEEWFGKTVINSDHRFTYEGAQEVIDFNNDKANKDKLLIYNPRYNGQISDESQTSIDNVNKCYKAILDLDRYAKMMRKERFKNGAISLDKQEVRFKLDENNKPVGIIFKVAKDANKLIEEYMLLANKSVAHFINSKKLPMVNRAHEKPNDAKLEKLKEFIMQFGYELDTNNVTEIAKTLNKLLVDVKGLPEANMIENLAVRTMQKANYTTKNIGHYGLGFKDYTHFTSPIRRYPDVMVHRLLYLYLEEKTLPKIEKLESRCIYLSEREKKAQKAERESIKYMQCVYMSDFIGKIFKGIVTSVMEYGVFVEISENGCEGLVRLSEINGDTFIADVNNYCIKGFNTGEVIRLGDEVRVVVSNVDLEKKNINLSLIKL